MEPWQLVAIMMSLALASYIQTLTGFAFGLIVMGLLATLDVLPIESAALLCTLLGLFNNGMAMRGHWREINPRLARRLLVTSLPMLPVGYFLAVWLGSERAPLLGMLLGIVILIACLALLAQPGPRATTSPRWHFHTAGVLSGLMGGAIRGQWPASGGRALSSADDPDRHSLHAVRCLHRHRHRAHGPQHRGPGAYRRHPAPAAARGSVGRPRRDALHRAGASLPAALE